MDCSQDKQGTAVGITTTTDKDHSAVPPTNSHRGHPTIILPDKMNQAAPAGSKRVKPALKQHPNILPTSSRDERDANDPKDETHRKKKKALTWDEHAIEEHDQLRGTRMKIDEPNTPYAHYDHDGHESDDSSLHPKSPGSDQQNAPSLAMHWDTLESKLVSVAAARENCPSSPSATSAASSHEGAQSDDEEVKRRKAEEFKKHRKQHYNEMEMLRRFRAEHHDDEDNEDDENEEQMEVS